MDAPVPVAATLSATAAAPPAVPPRRGGATATARRFALALLTVTFVFALVRFNPYLPGDTLDQGWMLGLGEAFAQGLAFGSRIVFTFGPYASLYSKTYHPATDTLMLVAGAYLALSFALAAGVLSRGRPWGWRLAMAAVVAALLPYPLDTLLLSYPVMAALAVRGWYGRGDTALAARSPLPARWMVQALLMAPLGLLALVKGTLIVPCTAVALLGAADLALKRQPRAAVLNVAVPALALVLFWLAAGQPLAALPPYVANMAPIAAGYTEAMAYPGRSAAVWSYLVSAVVFLAVLAGDRARPWRDRVFLGLLFALFLFVVFKASFVRHEARVLGAGSALVLACVMLGAATRTRAILALTAGAVLVWAFIARPHDRPGELAVRNVVNTFAGGVDGLRQRLRDGGWPRRPYDAAIAQIRARADLPALAGTVDVYSHGQSALIASGLRWNPRPVIQSYSAYLPSLAELNRRHLLGDGAPDHVVFAVEPIDGRLPPLEDGASWPLLRERYVPRGVRAGRLILDRRAGDVAEPRLLPLVATRTAAFGERVELPAVDGPVYAEIVIAPTALGVLAQVAFKPKLLAIEVELADGNRRSFRLVAGLAKSPFLLSPLVENTTEFALLWGPPAMLDGKRVKAFSVSVAQRGVATWRTGYQVRFSRPDRVAPPLDLSPLALFDPWAADLAGIEPVAAAHCDGGYDRVNGGSPSTAPVKAQGTLRVSGWLATSSEPPGTLPEAALVVLTDDGGRRLVARTRRTHRTDVGAHFHSPGLDRSGYDAVLDLSRLAGRVTASLALLREGRIEQCPDRTVVLDVTPVAAR